MTFLKDHMSTRGVALSWLRTDVEVEDKEKLLPAAFRSDAGSGTGQPRVYSLASSCFEYYFDTNINLLFTILLIC